jgi:transposase-like protein
MVIKKKVDHGRSCPNCKGRHLWKIGSVPTTSGLRARYKCVDCAHTFYADAPGKKTGKRK